MRLLKPLQLLLVLAIPLLVFLISFNISSFGSGFYAKKFSEYGVFENVQNAGPLHESVINFIKGKNDTLPQNFNQREKEHLRDVRQLVRISDFALYSLIILFLALAILLVLHLKLKNYILKSIGKAMLAGAFLALAVSALFLLLITLDFGASFDSFHRLLFEEGTYLFDPSSELLVRIYPQEIFMDIGVRISLWVLGLSIAVAVIGAFLVFKSKSNPSNKKQYK